MPHDLLDMSDADHRHKQCFARNMNTVETHDLSRYATSSLQYRGFLDILLCTGASSLWNGKGPKQYQGFRQLLFVPQYGNFSSN